MKPPEGMKLWNNGKRIDGRSADELRPIKIHAGVLKRADGSCYLEWGGNKVLAGVYGPREVHPRHDMNPTQAIVRCRYNMAAFSVGDRKRPGPDRRSQEISKVTSEALRPVILTHLFPRTAIDVFVEIIEAEAGSRCAGLTAASVALADAGIPMKGMVAACAAGKIDGHVVLDLAREEDNYGETDLPIATIPRTGEIVLLQMDGDFTDEELSQAIDMAIQACARIHEIQKQALRDRYKDAAVTDRPPAPPDMEPPTASDEGADVLEKPAGGSEEGW
ncbi:MAG TPA: exosome complex exonuclease Rrp41 [Candidatus Thermoplasmatota archaeon]|nr:exosome complex exonuclease Rrp41 [Candidatus Thermoplasmatota archaeon]